ncbi:MAG: hypothetical protein J6J23_06220, partial [Clostridia bacterium]|nr:hypothetical protein [Clostridia bacterium]
KLYEMASACSDNNGEVGKAKENPEWSATLSSLECGLTSLEFVALMFPVESNFHIKRGRVHLEKFTIIERDLEEFIERFGSANLLANIKKNDEVLYKRLNNLASTFPEGSISVSELLSFYGYVDDSRSMVVGESINEESTVEELRQMYEVALDKYFEDESAQFPVDMKVVNKIMNIHLSNSVLYSRLYKLALKKGMTLTNYINGKEIFAFQDIDVDGKIQRVKKQKDGKILPPLTYEIGLDSIKHSLIVIDDGREYTKYLKKKMIVAMFDNRILNDPSLPKEMKINERFKLAQTIMEEVIEEAKTIDEVIELANSD